MLMKVLLILA